MPTTPDANPAPPLLSIPCDGFSARQVDDAHAVLVFRNAVAHASLILDADGVRQVAEVLSRLADELTPAGPSLVTPPAAGRLVLPGADR